MSRWCLDTSAYSRFRRGSDEVVDLLDQAEWIAVPAVVLGELRTGFLLGNRRTRNEAELLEFLAHPVVSVLTVDDEVSRHYAGMVSTSQRSSSYALILLISVARAIPRSLAACVRFPSWCTSMRSM